MTPSTRAPVLRDVATLAGVSVTTVSRYLNGQIQLPEKTSSRIVEALRSLQYQPNPHAKRLSTGRTDTLGLVVPDIANPFYARMAAAIEAEADNRGLQLALFATLNRPGRERVYLEALRRNQVDGLIFATNHAEHGDLVELINASGKVIIVDEDVPRTSAPRLFCDNLSGGRLAGAYLASLGHRRVAYFGTGTDMLSGRLRLRGLREGMGSEAVITPFLCDYTREGGADAAARYVQSSHRATAIFAAADEVAIGAIPVLREVGLRIPDDVSMVGFDDVAPLHLFDPALTAIRQPIEQIGRRAVERLTAESTEAAPSEELLAVELVVRASCARPISSGL